MCESPENAAAADLENLLEVLLVTPLLERLQNPAPGRDHRIDIVDGQPEWFFAEYVFPGTQGLNRHCAVRVVECGNHN